MNLQESIRRILKEEDYSPAGKEITPNNIVIHKSNPMFRDRIMENGLKARAGECYKVYVGYGVKCKPAIFATNSTNKRAWFDSTYDDDIWEINTEMIPDVKWYKDRHFESRSKHIVTFQDIPKEAITLKYEGTGSGDVETWNKNSPNLYESIKRILKEETKSGKYTRALEIITNVLKKEDFVCDIEVKYYGAADTYEVIVKIDKKEMETNFEKLSIWYAEKLIKEYLSDLRKKVEKEIRDFLPVKVLVYIDQFSCNKKLNESEGKKGKYITMIEDLTDYFKNEDCVCDIQVKHKPEEFRDSYLITVVLGNKDLDDKFNGISWQISEYRTKLKRKITNGILEFLPIPFYIEFRQTPKCSDYKNLQESEEKKSRLLSNIEKNGLYEVISSTGLHINEIEQRVGQLSREILERFIKDVVKEHFQVTDDDGKTYIIYLEDYPFDAVPIGNSDYIDQLRVTNNKLFILVTLYEEDEYGDLEEQSYEIVSPKNLSYTNIYEIAGQLGFLLSKGQI